jgi:hypothetical protein
MYPTKTVPMFLLGLFLGLMPVSGCDKGGVITDQMNCQADPSTGGYWCDSNLDGETIWCNADFSQCGSPP